MAEEFLKRCELVFEASSFGGVHTTAERRARWGGDQIAEGFIRKSIGCEDAQDLIADLSQALDASHGRNRIAFVCDETKLVIKASGDSMLGPAVNRRRQAEGTMKDDTKTPIFQMMAEMGHEQVVFCHDEASGYRGIIAIHSTKLGPAVGGTRFWNYATEEDAIIDALRLSRGMTYKCAAAGMPLGGGKAIIIGDNKTRDREKLFRAHGRFVERMGGRYITSEDAGTSPADMELVALETSYVGGLPGKGGDPSPWTGLGAVRAMQAAAQYRWGSDDLRDKRVAIQGCGNVGYNLARELHAAGARVIVSDIEAGKTKLAVDAFDAAAALPDEIYSVEADVFAPCALGGIINDRTILQLKAEIVCGAANNQLFEERHGDALEARGILYAPDYVANAGGVLSGGAALFGWPPEKVRAKVLAIYDTMLSIFEIARAEGIPTYKAADRLAERRLREGVEHSSARW